MERKQVGIVIFDDVEILDFCGPYEVFSAVRLDEPQRRETLSPFNVQLVAEHLNPITTTGGMVVQPHCSFANCPDLDILLVPGGWGTRIQINNNVLLEWLKSRSKSAEVVASVCTGSMVLGFAGLLDGRRATTHWRSLAWMAESLTAVKVQSDKHFVVDGHVFTSAGISAGIDMSLKVVERYYSRSIAEATARHMEYPYPASDARRIVL
ncbi:MAG: DJ-1/PfpI family protein [Pirellulaceae bacterium]|nr:DJ-1/PfpI family protein [Pirellulaceae bacterium]